MKKLLVGITAFLMAMVLLAPAAHAGYNGGCPITGDNNHTCDLVHNAPTDASDSGHNFSNIAGQLWITLPLAPTVGCELSAAAADTSHWIGIADGNLATNLVQAGYTWSDPSNTGGHFYLRVFWEFYNGVKGGSPVYLYNSQTGYNILGFTPATGDHLYFNFWFGGSTYWGLHVQDLTQPGTQTYAANIHPTYGSAVDYIQPAVEMVTEEQNNGDNLINDGQMTFKQVQAYDGTWKWVENFSGPSATYNMVNGPVTKETATAPDTAAYAYHTYRNCQ